MITVTEIVIKYLRENGFDGLCGDECGCGIEDLAPCQEGWSECVPAHARILGPDEHLNDCGPGDTYYSPEKSG